MPEIHPSVHGDTMEMQNTKTKIRYHNEFLQLHQVLAPPSWPSGIPSIHNKPTVTSDDREKEIMYSVNPTTDDDDVLSKPSEGDEIGPDIFYQTRLDPATELRENILEALSCSSDKIDKSPENPRSGPLMRREKNPLCIINPDTGRDIFEKPVSDNTDPPRPGEVRSKERKLLRIVNPATGCDITGVLFSSSAEEKDDNSEPFIPTMQLTVPFLFPPHHSTLCELGGQHHPSTNTDRSDKPHTSPTEPPDLWRFDGPCEETADSDEHQEKNTLFEEVLNSGKEQTPSIEDSVRGHAQADHLPYSVEESQMVGIPQYICPIAHINPDLQWMSKDIQALRDQLQDQPSRPVIIAVLDSGIYEHPDLQGIVLANKNFVPRKYGDVFCQEEDLIQDSCNHGTKVAGIIWQIAGCCTKILNLKVLRSTGTGSLSYIRSALRYIEQWDGEHPDEKVDVILMSFGTAHFDKPVSRQLSRLGEDKVIIAAAANDGNIKAETILFPAKHPYVIAIGSCDKLGNRCSHSSKGHELSFLFPGSEIQSTSSLCRLHGDTHRYATGSGTSFAAPHCAGISALLIVLIERSLGTQMRSLLTSSYHIKNILRDKNICGRTPTLDDGYGMPDISRITEASIYTYLKEHIEFRE